jgi:uncharacterized protein (DUF302 family)
MPLEAATNAFIAIVESHGMTVLSDIDVNASLKRRLGIDIAGYRIVSACHADHSVGAPTRDGRRAAMLHCKAVLIEQADGSVQIDMSGGHDQDTGGTGVVSITDAAESLIKEMFAERTLAVAA